MTPSTYKHIVKSTVAPVSVRQTPSVQVICERTCCICTALDVFFLLLQVPRTL